MAYSDYLPEWTDLWSQSDMSPIKFFELAYKAGRIDWSTYQSEMQSGGWEPDWTLLMVGAEYHVSDYATKDPAAQQQAADAAAAAGGYTPMWTPSGIQYTRTTGEPVPTIESRLTVWFKAAFNEALVSLWEWTLQQVKSLVDAVITTIAPLATQAWESASGKLNQWGIQLYNEVQKLAGEPRALKPEDAGPLAIKLYLSAMTAGMGAHGVSILTELLHPLKSMGLHQTAAMIGDFGQFGRISAAIMSPLVNGVLGKAMQYSMNAAYRPTVPFESLLIEMRSKREIDKKQFAEAMAYQGFSDKWLDAIERWQWKDPRMFEILRIADVGMEQGKAPSEEQWWFEKYGVTGDKLKDWWLWRKFMRAGYEDVDIPVMVRLVHRREVAFALTYVRTAIRRNYRWGYLSDEDLEKWMDRLSLPEQAKEWIFWAGELDRDYFYKQDLQKYYVTAYQKDVLDEDELMVSLISMGMPARDVALTVRFEKLKKKPKPSADVPAEVKRPLAKIQTTYIQLYREQFKQGLIDSKQYYRSLVAVEIDPELARITVDLDSTKLAPESAEA